MSDHLGCWEGGVEEGTNLTFACEHGVGREGSYGSLICGLLPGRCTNTNDEGSRLEVRLHLQPLSLIRILHKSSFFFENTSEKRLLF